MSNHFLHPAFSPQKNSQTDILQLATCCSQKISALMFWNDFSLSLIKASFKNLFRARTKRQENGRVSFFIYLVSYIVSFVTYGINPKLTLLLKLTLILKNLGHQLPPNQSKNWTSFYSQGLKFVPSFINSSFSAICKMGLLCKILLGDFSYVFVD